MNLSVLFNRMSLSELLKMKEEIDKTISKKANLVREVEAVLIDDTDLSTRAKNALKSKGVLTISQLEEIKPSSLSSIPMVGQQTLTEIYRFIATLKKQDGKELSTENA